MTIAGVVEAVPYCLAHDLASLVPPPKSVSQDLTLSTWAAGLIRTSTSYSGHQMIPLAIAGTGLSKRQGALGSGRTPCVTNDGLDLGLPRWRWLDGSPQ